MRGYILRYLQQYPELLDLVANDTVESTATRYTLLTLIIFLTSQPLYVLSKTLQCHLPLSISIYMRVLY